jgi:selenium metabolism protein YedF
VDRTVDARGLPCPRPVVETKKALEEVGQGVVTILVDSIESRDNVRRFAESQGCPVEVEEKEGAFRLKVTKGQPAQTPQPEPVTGNYVVFITTDRLGTGDERLGEILMKAFLNTLWDHDPKPARILFMNSGVFLTTEGSDVLDALRLLEAAGVRIVSCGTCLAYYGLTEKLQVGAGGNMYEIVDSLVAAPKVIKI